MNESYTISRNKVTTDKVVIFIMVRGKEFGTSVSIGNPSLWDSELQVFANLIGARLDEEERLKNLADAL